MSDLPKLGHVRPNTSKMAPSHPKVFGKWSQMDIYEFSHPTYFQTSKLKKRSRSVFEIVHSLVNTSEPMHLCSSGFQVKL